MVQRRFSVRAKISRTAHRSRRRARTYNFVRYDTHRRRNLPHTKALRSPRPQGRIGPKTDLYGPQSEVPGNLVILVTDGEPSTDLDERMSAYADDLFNELEVRTYVVGIGLSQAKWKNAAAKRTLYCDTLTDDDLGANRMCERAPANEWKYADVWPHNTMTSDPYPGLSASQKRTSIRACCELLETAVAGGTERRSTEDTNRAAAALLRHLQLPLGRRIESHRADLRSDQRGVHVRCASERCAVYFERALDERHADNSMCVATSSASLRVRRAQPSCGAIARDVAICSRRTSTTRRPTSASSSPSTRSTASLDGTIRSTVQPQPRRPLRWRKPRRLHPPRRCQLRLGAADDLVRIQTWWWPRLVGLDDASVLLGLTGNEIAEQTRWAVHSRRLRRRVLRWLGDPIRTCRHGSAVGSGQTGSQCVDVNCSPMGAIYRSVPVIVPPPVEADSDDQSYGRTRVVGSDPSFVGEYGARPSMVYSQTIDGLLHAFVLSKNDYTVGGVPEFDKAPSAVTDDTTRSGHSCRQRSFRSSGVSSTSTAACSTGSGVGKRGLRSPGRRRGRRQLEVQDGDHRLERRHHARKGFYYALDVTDPFVPQFLWQLRTSGDGAGSPQTELFGN